MNMIMLLILALVLCAYFWSDCPKMLKDNKQMLLGVVVGLILCKYFKGDLVEGFWTFIITAERDKNGRGVPACHEFTTDGNPSTCKEAGMDPTQTPCWDSESDCLAVLNKRH